MGIWWKSSSTKVTVWQALTFGKVLMLVVCVKLQGRWKAACLMVLDSFLSVKEGSLHSRVQDYCYIQTVILQYYFYTSSHFLIGFLFRFSYCDYVPMSLFSQGLLYLCRWYPQAVPKHWQSTANIHCITQKSENLSLRCQYYRHYLINFCLCVLLYCYYWHKNPKKLTSLSHSHVTSLHSICSIVDGG